MSDKSSKVYIQLSSFEGFYVANSAWSDHANSSKHFLADFLNNLGQSCAKLSTALVHEEKDFLGKR